MAMVDPGKWSVFNYIFILQLNDIYSLAIFLSPLKRPRLKNLIKPKQLTFSEDMGVASKSSAKSLDVATIKPQAVKLIEIKLDPLDVTAIKLRVEATKIKMKPLEKAASMTASAEDKNIVTDEIMAKELGDDYIPPCS